MRLSFVFLQQRYIKNMMWTKVSHRENHFLPEIGFLQFFEKKRNGFQQKIKDEYDILILNGTSVAIIETKLRFVSYSLHWLILNRKIKCRSYAFL